MSPTRSLILLAILPALGTIAGAGAGASVTGRGFIRHSVVAKAPTSERRWVKRQDQVSLENQMAGTIYTLELGLGTPSQEVTVIIDTGSSELWVNPECCMLGRGIS